MASARTIRKRAIQRTKHKLLDRAIDRIVRRVVQERFDRMLSAAIPVPPAVQAFYQGVYEAQEAVADFAVSMGPEKLSDEQADSLLVTLQRDLGAHRVRPGSGDCYGVCRGGV